MEKEAENQQTGDDKGIKLSSAIPVLELPKSGGAIKGVGEKFSVNPATGAGNFSIPIGVTKARGAPSLNLSYSSSAGNSPFGMGWGIDVPQVTRKTEKKLPLFNNSDTFIMSGAEDLVPTLISDDSDADNIRWSKKEEKTEGQYKVVSYRPRTEGLFARIEQLTHEHDKSDVFWRTISGENITSIFGDTKSSRIQNPNDSTNIFSWLLSRTYDDKGNITLYQYKQEDEANASNGLSETQRKRNSQPQQYLKKILYGNQTMYSQHIDLLESDFLFKIVFDYGEHDIDLPEIKQKQGQLWPQREDAFSSYRSGFEIRTRRLCSRVLLFHTFPQQFELGTERLIQSTDITYDENPIATQIKSITQNAYELDGSSYTKNDLPPIEFTYSKATVDEAPHSIDAPFSDNVPQGLSGNYQFTDLNTEGLSGVLIETSGAWYYKRNLGKGKFGPIKEVIEKPNWSNLGGNAQLSNIESNGQLYLSRQGTGGGFSRRADDGSWSPFKSYENNLNIDLSDPDIRYVDLNGDGKPEIIILRDQLLRWYPNEGEKGYQQENRNYIGDDQSKGPSCVFRNDLESIFLTDMSGDGLADIVRISPNNICYWPNLGYGRFGEQVIMDNAPTFDSSDFFDSKKIRLGDIDGSGTTDILYLGRNRTDFFLNQSGNGFDDAIELKGFPAHHSQSVVSLVDLLANGTSCLVWSSPLEADALAPWKYIDIMGSSKPYLLTEVRNNMGAVSRVRYKPSTHYYIKDEQQGNPWITKLPFPVQVIDQSEVEDLITGRRFVSEYAYHHGYYDREEREYRGFGFVEQWDDESFTFEDPKLLAPTEDNPDLLYRKPRLHTKSWFHTGAWEKEKTLSSQYEIEYWQSQALLSDSELLDAESWTTNEIREAKRALRGQLLRTELFADDDTPEADKPYTVSESRYQVKQVQPTESNKHAVYISLPLETVTAHYERNTNDPRLSHEVTTKFDNYANVLQSVAIAYPRQIVGQTDERIDEQKDLKIIVTENDFFNQDDPNVLWYLKNVPISSKVFELELNEQLKDTSALFGINQINSFLSEFSLDVTNKKILSAQVNYYRKNSDANSLVPNETSLRKVESLALPYATYQLIVTDDILEAAYNDILIPKGIGNTLGWEDHLTNEKYKKETHAKETGWWISGGFAQYDDDDFYITTQSKDPWGNISTIEYDSINLLPIKVIDPLGNTIEAKYDYRILQPLEITDPNGNRNQVAYDGFGRVMRTAVMGKVIETKGDELSSTPRNSHNVVDSDTTVIEYNQREFLDFGKPNYVHRYTRETHHHNLAQGETSRWMEARVYSDGFGQELQSKAKVEAKEAYSLDGNGTLQTNPNPTPRWLASGHTIYDNKGQPVKQFEPYFSTTKEYEAEEHLMERGVSPLIHYDPLGRVIRTDMPDGTYSKVKFNPWMQKTYDANDTVADSDWRIRMQNGSAQQQRALQHSLVHNDTATLMLLDVLGRPVKTIVHNKDAINGDGGNPLDEKHTTQVVLDTVGNELKVIDANNYTASIAVYDLVGRPMKSISNDAGTSYALMTIDNQPAMAWLPRGQSIRMEYDDFRRSKYLWLRESSTANEIIKEAIIYGEDYQDSAGSTAKDKNMLGQVWKSYDQAGIAEINEYDFKGAPLESTRHIFDDYMEQGNWSGLEDTLTQIAPTTESFSSSIEYDALGRPIQSTAPDGSITANKYDQSGALIRVETKLAGAALFKAQVSLITYNEKGLRDSITYGNGANSNYTYDPLTYRLTNLKSNNLQSIVYLQNLDYTYDGNGNIVEIKDNAQQTVYFKNAVVEAKQQFVYDGLNRLVQVKGREHIGQQSIGEQLNTPQAESGAIPYNNAASSDLTALENYTESYRYDGVGNIQDWRHNSSNAYSRVYEYRSDNNQLINTAVGTETTDYQYDAAGNIIKLSHHASPIEWNVENQPVHMDFGSSKKAYYRYDAGGERFRKVILKGNNLNIKEERLYFGNYELYRKYKNGILEKQRKTLHIGDDTGRICIVETLTDKPLGDAESTQPIYRYQLSNHLGSVGIELDKNANIISYEEYHPYGTSAFFWKSSSISQKRYRYTGKERDDESGLSYHSARYYMPWLGRWLSADPAGMVDGSCLYQYSLSNPVMLQDDNGMQTTDDVLKTVEQTIDIVSKIASIADVFSSENVFIKDSNSSSTFSDSKTIKSVSDISGISDDAKYLVNLIQSSVENKETASLILEKIGVLSTADIKDISSVAIKLLMDRAEDKFIKFAKEKINKVKKYAEEIGLTSIETYGSVSAKIDVGLQLDDDFFAALAIPETGGLSLAAGSLEEISIDIVSVELISFKAEITADGGVKVTERENLTNNKGIDKSSLDYGNFSAGIGSFKIGYNAETNKLRFLSYEYSFDSNLNLVSFNYKKAWDVKALLGIGASIEMGVKKKKIPSQVH